MREQIIDRFEGMLDIRSFVKVQTNLSIMLSLLFTEKQRLLFKLNKDHVVIERKTASCEPDDPIEFNLSKEKMKFSKKALNTLLGYQVKTELDRKLLQGIFGR